MTHLGKLPKYVYNPFDKNRPHLNTPRRWVWAGRLPVRKEGQSQTGAHGHQAMEKTANVRGVVQELAQLGREAALSDAVPPARVYTYIFVVQLASKIQCWTKYWIEVFKLSY